MRRFIVLLFLLYLSAGICEIAAQERLYQVKTINEEAFEELVHARAGNVLLINIWATWCQPCREEFPDLVRLATYYADDQVDIVAISVDYPDEIEQKIRPFLEKMQANFPVYVADFADNEDLINRLNPEWSGALPASIVYDSLAVARRFHLGKADFETFQALVESAR